MAIAFIREKDVDSLEIFPIYGEPGHSSTERFLVRCKDSSVWFYEVTFSNWGIVDDSLNKAMVFPAVGE